MTRCTTSQTWQCLFLSLKKQYVFLCPSYITYLSDCHGLPSNKWQASIGATSHHTSSLYDLQIENETRHRVLTLISFSFCSQHNLYGFGCGTIFKPNFWTIFVETTFLKLPLSIIIRKTLPCDVHFVWETFFLNQSSLLSSQDTLRFHWTTMDKPWSA